MNSKSNFIHNFMGKKQISFPNCHLIVNVPLKLSKYVNVVYKTNKKRKKKEQINDF
jgi:hypothetical protein